MTIRIENAPIPLTPNKRVFVAWNVTTAICNVAIYQDLVRLEGTYPYAHECFSTLIKVLPVPYI